MHVTRRNLQQAQGAVTILCYTGRFRSWILEICIYMHLFTDYLNLWKAKDRIIYLSLKKGEIKKKRFFLAVMARTFLGNKMGHVQSMSQE